MIKNFADKTFIIFFIAILLVSSVFVLNFDKGIEFTDESYLILYFHQFVTYLILDF